MRQLSLCLLLAGPAPAQAPLEFSIIEAASQWSWSGTTDLGPLIGNPSTDFELTDTFDLLVNSGAQPLDSGEFVSGGAATVVPDLSGQIPNPFPGLPPLAVLDITNLTLEFTTPNFAIDPAGNFNTTVVVVALSGMLTVTPIVGPPTTTDLTGTTGDPTPYAGHIKQNTTSVKMAAASSSSFVFVDPGSGITGTINLVGDLVGQHDCRAPQNYCVSENNSTGSPAVITSSGSTRIQDNSLTLIGNQLPNNKFAYFIMSEATTFIPNVGGSQGNLCVGSPQIRFSAFVLNSGSIGSVKLTIDMNNLPQFQVFHPGDDWNFQLWYRDNNPGATSNFTDGLTVWFCP